METVLPQVRALAAGAEKTSEVYPAIRLLLMALGDHHSFLLPAATKRAYEGMKKQGVEARLQEPGIGYVNIPAYSGSQRAAMESQSATPTRPSARSSRPRHAAGSSTFAPTPAATSAPCSPPSAPSWARA
jgi:hypothetical protein